MMDFSSTTVVLPAKDISNNNENQQRSGTTTKKNVDNNDARKLELNKSISSLSHFEQIEILHIDPLVIGVNDFFTDEECDRYVKMSLKSDGNGDGGTLETRSKTVGKDTSAKEQRTSTTWFHHYRNVPELLAKACRLLGLSSDDGIERWEEPQTVRYRRNEKFTWHLDA